MRARLELTEERGTRTDSALGRSGSRDAEDVLVVERVDGRLSAAPEERCRIAVELPENSERSGIFGEAVGGDSDAAFGRAAGSERCVLVPAARRSV